MTKPILAWAVKYEGTDYMTEQYKGFKIVRVEIREVKKKRK